MSEIYRGKNYQWRKISSSTKIAEGGNGEIFLVICDELEGEFVCKALKSSRQSDGIKKQRFINEIKIVSSINDPFLMKHIIPIIDEPPEGEYWYIMPKAQCLRELLEMGKLDFITRLNFCKELGVIIKHMHSLSTPIAHRDIKPDNIFIYNENVCLSDFGLEWDETNTVDTPDSTAIAAAITGPLWAMPFQWTVEASELYFAIDVYEYVKTVWLILTMENVVYKEIYSLENSRVYLTHDKIHADNISYNLFPLHKLMTFANADNYTKMKSIDDCLHQLDTFNQVNFLKKRDAIREANLDQAVFDIIEKPDVKEYKDIEKIASILLKLSKLCFLQMPARYSLQRLRISDVRFRPTNHSDKMLMSLKTDTGLMLHFYAECLRVCDGTSKIIEVETLRMDEFNELGTKISELIVLPGMPLVETDLLIDVACMLELVPMDELTYAN